MADTNNKDRVLIEVQFDTDKAAKNIAEATKVLNDQKAALDALKKETDGFKNVSAEQAKEIANVKKSIEEQMRAIKSNTAVLQAADTTVIDTTMSLEKQRQKVNELQKAYAALDGDQKKLADEQGLPKSIKEATDLLKAQEAAIGDNRRNVGNYAESFNKALSGIGNTTKQATDLLLQSGAAGKEMAGGLQAVSHVADAFTKHPLLGVLQILWEVISGNEEAMNGLKRIITLLGQAFAKVEPYITKFAGVLTNVLLAAVKGVIEGVKWVLQGIDSLAAKLGKNLHLADSFDKLTESIKNTTIVTDEMKKQMEDAAKAAEKARKEAAELYVQQMELNHAVQTALGLFKSIEDPLYKLAKAAKVAKEAMKDLREEEEAEIDADAEESMKKLEKLWEKKGKLMEQIGLVQKKTEFENEMSALEELHNAKLMSEEEYQEAKAAIQDQYRQAEMEKVAQEISEWGGQLTNAMSNISAAINASEDAQLQKYKKDNEEKKKALDKRLNAGKISQEQYDKSVAKMDEELAIKENEIAVKQAKRDKAVGITNAIINTAAAIMKIWAEVPKGDFGISTGILTALAAATGAAQIATIAATPLPEMSTGGIVEGNYAQGDVHPTMLAGQEMVINPTQQKNLWDAANGGGVGGGIDYDILAQKVAQANASLPAPVLVYREFKDFQSQSVRYQQIASI